MIKIKKVTQLEDVKAGDYIRHIDDDLFELITEVMIDVGQEDYAYITYGEFKLMITQVELMEYQFGEVDLQTDDIAMDIVYRCNKCHNPSVVFDSQEQALHHVERCLFNPEAKKCVMCKHLKIIEEPPYPRFKKDYQSLETYHAFGAYKQPYCMLKEENITEYNLFDNHDDCFVYSDENIVTEQTEAMKKYVELINSDIEVQKTTIGDMIKNNEQ